jgi:hypothetical protein
MPVRRFRSIEEMKTPRWREPGDPDLVRALAALWELARRTGTRRFPPGVHRYESIDAMHEAQERWAGRSSP